MSPERARLLGAATLREEFDRSFAVAPQPPEALTAFLAIQIGGDPYALRLRDVESLHRDRKVVRLLQRRDPQFLGLSSFRGTLAPVYDLRALLGRPSDGRSPRWQVLVRAPSPVGLAFDHFECQLRAHEASIVAPGSSPSPGPDGAQRHVEAILRHAALPRPILRVASVLEAIARQFPQDRSSEEQ
jgi:purine-binding chemotaxis protein CheW